MAVHPFAHKKLRYDPQADFVQIRPRRHIEALGLRLNAAVHKALGAPAVRERLVGLGFNVALNSSEELAEQLRSELGYWAPLVKRSGFVAME